MHVNLIRYNETGENRKASLLEQANQFLEILKNNRIQGTIRQNLGGDIQGACGQLAGSETNKSNNKK